MDGYASEGLRVLAFGVHELDPRHPLPEDREQVETELTFVGLAAMLDPPRAEVAGAVRQCHAAGIRIIVVTGDHPLTSAAVAREVATMVPAERGLMQRPPRPRREGVIQPGMLVRSWLFLGLVATALQMGAFFFVLRGAGWYPGAPTGAGQPLHHAYQQATTVTFLSMVMGQVGTAVAARTDRASLRSVGLFSNRLLVYASGSSWLWPR